MSFFFNIHTFKLYTIYVCVKMVKYLLNIPRFSRGTTNIFCAIIKQTRLYIFICTIIVLRDSPISFDSFMNRTFGQDEAFVHIMPLCSPADLKFGFAKINASQAHVVALKSPNLPLTNHNSRKTIRLIQLESNVNLAFAVSLNHPPAWQITVFN